MQKHFRLIFAYREGWQQAGICTAAKRLAEKQLAKERSAKERFAIKRLAVKHGCWGGLIDCAQW
jgi:hypothetical protein